MVAPSHQPTNHWCIFYISLGKCYIQVSENKNMQGLRDVNLMASTQNNDQSMGHLKLMDNGILSNIPS